MWSFLVPYASLLCCILLLCINMTSGGDTRTVLERAEDCSCGYVSSCEDYRAAVQRVARASMYLGERTETVLLDLQNEYPHQCYVYVKSSELQKDAESLCGSGIGMLPTFTKYNMIEAAAVWKATGSNSLWTGAFRYKNHTRYSAACSTTYEGIRFDKDEFEWAKYEPSVDSSKHTSETYIHGSMPTKLLETERNFKQLNEFVCLAILNHSRTSTQSSTAPSTLLAPLGQNAETSDSSDSADLTGVWVTIGLLMTICLLATVFIVYKKVRARQDMKSQATENTAKSMENKHSDAQPRMQRNDMGRLHTHDTLSMTSEVQSEGKPAVLGLHSTTASASGVHIGNIVDVHQISRVDPNRGKCDETADGQSAISGNTFPFQP